MDFSLEQYVDAMPRLLVVHTTEEDRFVEDLHGMVSREASVVVWNDVFGAVDSGTYLDEFTGLDAPTADEFGSLSQLLREAYANPGAISWGSEGPDPEKPAFYVILDGDDHGDSDNVQRYLKQICQSGMHHPNAKRTVMLVSESGEVPASLDPYAEVCEYGLPSAEELRNLLQEYEDRAREWEFEVLLEHARDQKKGFLKESDVRRLEKSFEPTFTLPTDRDEDSIPESFVQACSGMTRYQIQEAIYSLYTVKGEVCESDLLAYRKQQVAKSDVLEFVETKVTFDDVAGLENQKEWLDEVGHCFTDEGRDWGLVPPKGLLQVGVPGCGKSLTAKAVSNEWGLPLIRFDTGRVFSSRVGASEAKMRRALEVIESCSPAILWLDEIEKGMSGVQSSNKSDAGTTSRVIGTFLTWFEEHSEEVFLVATSNDISEVPSELVSRFDEVFFVDLPGEDARRDCFKIHLSQYWKPQMGELDDIDFDRLAVASEYFTGREIDQVVRESLRTGYDQGGMDTEVVEETLRRKPPMLLTMQEEIDHLVEWVGYDEDTGQGIRARMASRYSLLAERLRTTPIEDGGTDETE